MAFAKKIRLWHQDTTGYALLGTTATAFWVDTDARAAFGQHAISGANATTDLFTIAGDYHLRFVPGMKFVITGSTAGADDGVWTVESCVYTSPNTYIYVVEDVTGAAGDGTIHFCRQFLISGVSTASEYFCVDDDLRTVLYSGKGFYVDGSTGNDGSWTTSGSVAYANGSTKITVTGNITNAVIDGWIVVPGGVAFLNTGSANPGNYRVDTLSLTTTTHTVIGVTNTLTPAGATGTLYPIDYLDFDLGGRVVPTYNKPGERVIDRLGLPHRIVPVTTANKQRHVTGAVLYIPAMDVDIESAMALRVPEFIEKYCIEGDEYLTIFTQFSSMDQKTRDYTENQAYYGKLEEVPDWLYSTYAGSENTWPDEIALPLLVSNDGYFSNYDILGSTTYRTRP